MENETKRNEPKEESVRWIDRERGLARAFGGDRTSDLLLYGNVQVGNSTVLQDHSTGLGFRPHGEVDQPQGPGCRHRRSHANEPRLVT